MVNYQNTYDSYWENADRLGESSGDMHNISALIVKTCGLGNVLDIGSGEGELVAALLREGVTVKGIDVSEVIVDRATNKFGPHFIKGSVLSLPFESASYHTVVSTDCMEHLEPADVPLALSEMYRVAGKYVFLQLATTVDRDGHWHLTVEKRDWWENRCFEAGFRKHPAYYTLNYYEALNEDPWQIFILLEKVPENALLHYPLTSLEAESGLHMDMSRVTGERSDAHMIRYHWSCDYIRSGDRVLDAACGLGYGSRLVARQTLAESVRGIDGSEWAINYATDNFASMDEKLSFEVGFLPDYLSKFSDGSFDVILSFETLEHVEDPNALIKEFHRLLSPGGRVIVSVPNDWSDESGEDPNPYHLQVYTWDRLAAELGSHFIVESKCALDASQAKIPANPPYWIKKARSIRPVLDGEDKSPISEWCLMTAMKSPLENTIPYREGVFSNVGPSGHPSIMYQEFYKNPWLMHAMVNVSYRLKNKASLVRLCSTVMRTSSEISNDYAAALCVSCYLHLDQQPIAAELEIQTVLIDNWLASAPSDAMSLRWKVSLSFVKAKIMMALGRFDDAIAAFETCCATDISEFGIHLSTKLTEAFYWAGRLCFATGRQELALQYWTRGIEYGDVLQSFAVKDIVINPEFPNLYNYGDGTREYALAWDSIARCANGVHLLKSGNFSLAKLDSSLASEYSTVIKDLKSTRTALKDCRKTIELLTHENNIMRNDLIVTRELLIERTNLLESCYNDMPNSNEQVALHDKTFPIVRRLIGKVWSRIIRSR